MFANSIYHKRETKRILERIHEDWESLNDEKERQILSDYADVGNIMTWMYLGTCYSTVLLFCAFPLTPIVMDYVVPLNESREKWPMYRTEFFVDQDKYFYSILVHNFFVTVVGMSAIMNVDIYIATITQHICGMLAILRKRLENTYRKGHFGKLEDNIFNETVVCLKMHNNIIELSLPFDTAYVIQCFNNVYFFSLLQIVNEMLRTSFGILLMILVLMMSFTGLVVLVKWGMWAEVIRFGLFTIAELFHTFCYSYHSQNLINHNEQVFDAIRCSGWYQSSMRTRGLINMMLLRCTKPFLILCMIFPLSMENFTLIIKTSFSYFTVVKSTR